MRGLWKAVFLIAFGLCSVSINAQGTLTYGGYKTLLQSGQGAPPDTLQVYMNGIVMGLNFANAQLSHFHQPELFCVPGKLGVGAQLGFSVLSGFVESHKNAVSDEDDLAMLVLLAFDDTFPCDHK
jgi:hypothetical protein